MNCDIIGDCKCCLGDNMALLRSMKDKSVDFVLTDIPYELDLSGKNSGKFAKKFSTCRYVAPYNTEDKSLYFVSKGIDYDAVFTEFERVCRHVNMCIFCSNKQISRIMSWWEQRGYSVTLCVWDKPNPVPLCGHTHVSNLEFIVYVRGKGATFNNLGCLLQKKTFSYLAPPVSQRLHETEKPQALLSHLLALHTNEGDTVLDPYAGSFSTAIACHRAKRKFIGCEILPKYYEPAMRRLRSETAQQMMF